MSVQRSLAAKRNTGAGTTGDIDTILPLLFAANPSITPNYKKMSAMDSHGRTAAALEHKFRKWRQIGREILAAHPEEAGKDHAVGQPAQTKTPRTPKKQGNKNDREGEDGNLKPKVMTTSFILSSRLTDVTSSSQRQGNAAPLLTPTRSPLQRSQEARRGPPRSPRGQQRPCQKLMALKRNLERLR